MLSVLTQTIIITYFVLSMIMLIEYINVKTNGICNNYMKKHSGVQIIAAALLGLIPGCLGSYSLVSLYTHGIVGFGALIANLIATTGDEAFFMYALMPQKALIINALLLVIAILTGYAVNIIAKKKKNTCGQEGHFELHEADNVHKTSRFSKEDFTLKPLTFHRIVMIGAIVVFMVLLMSGVIESDHNHDASTLTTIQLNHHHDDAVVHHHDSKTIDWVTATFVVISLFSLFIVLTVPEHFLNHHLWNHIIKKHLLKVFLWTLFALSAIELLNMYFDVENFVSGNYFYILCAAIIIGLIPESGPHLVFVSLYLSGSIPLSILIANSIVQDGHGAIPLFAENKKDFFIVKGLKFIIAFVIGIIFFN